MAKRSITDLIVIHCSATRPNMDIGAKEIRDWHVKGNHWADIGYHFVIRRNGKTEKGRAIDQIGAHVAGYNHRSVGICLVGGVSQKDYTKAEDNFTQAQWKELERLVRMVLKTYPKCTILGHRDLDSGKACPSFEVKDWLKGKNVG